MQRRIALLGIKAALCTSLSANAPQQADRTADGPSYASYEQYGASSCALRSSCDNGAPSATRTSFRSWTNRAVALTGARHRGRDQIVREGSRVFAVGKFVYGPFDKDLESEDVEVFVQKNCSGTWISKGVVRTGVPSGVLSSLPASVGRYSSGSARVVKDLTDMNLPVGRHRVSMVVKGDLTRAEHIIEVVPRDAKYVVTDVDGTLTESNSKLLSDENSALPSFVGLRSPSAHAGAADVLSQLARKGYYIIYLTARPEWVMPVTRLWLKQKGFPPGIIHTTLTTTGLFNQAAADFKAAELRSFRDAFGSAPSYAFGNRESDVAAYKTAGATMNRTYYYRLSGKNLQGGVLNNDYRTLIPTMQAAPSACP